MGDWPDQDALTASLASTGTTVTVADTDSYFPNQALDVDYETMIVRAKPTATTLTVLRAAYGSTAASHANSSSVVKSPGFYSVLILDALSDAIEAAFPLLYKPVIDETLSLTAGTYEYTVPNLPTPSSTVPIPALSRLYVKETGDTVYRKVEGWWVNRGATPKIVFKRDPAPGTLRVLGYGPFGRLTATSDTLDAQWPLQAEHPLVMYAAQWLLASGEARRVRADSGQPLDARENANRAGSSMAASNALFQRFRIALSAAAMPAMPPHVVPVI
jgi:hypothetical protein